jgi:hypothetical protein
VASGTSTVACPQCGALVPAGDGPRHVYVPAASGCWAAFGALRADEMQRFPRSPDNNVVVDAYMAQHPGDGADRRDRQSVFVHLVSLCAVLERGGAPSASPDVLRAVLAGRRDFPVLPRTHGPGELTVLHVVGARDEADHDRRARAWAASVWQAWHDHHSEIRSALDAAGPRWQVEDRR